MLIKRSIRIIFSTLPLFIIGGLLYVALYVKPQPGLAVTNPYSIVKRDRFYGVASPTPTTVWAVGSHGKIVRSDDAGGSWVVQPVPEPVNLQGIAAWDEKKAVVVGNAGTVLITSDGGKSWTKVKTPLDDPIEEEATEDGSADLSIGGMSYGRTAEQEKEEKGQVAAAAESARKSRQKLLNIAILPDGNAWIVGEMGIVLHSKDFGATWERKIKPEDVAWNGVAVIGKKGWLVGEAGRIMRTEDGGETWTAVKSLVEGSLMGVAFRDEDHGVAVGLEGVVLVTKDGGKNWAQASGVTIEHLFDIMWDGAAAEWVAVGDKGLMLKGDSSGADWKGKRITDLDTSWYTNVAKSGDRYYLSGARLSVLEKGELKFFDKKI
jgi:photosystem II stability/assembly factor-like uncharacterized protein